MHSRTVLVACPLSLSMNNDKDLLFVDILKLLKALAIQAVASQALANEREPKSNHTINFTQ